MAEIKVVVSDPKTGKSYQKVVPEGLMDGMKIGDKVNGDLLEMPGYELIITGGSDNAGFPMRKDIQGTGRKRPLLSGGVGVWNRFKKHKVKGLRIRKTVHGNTISSSIAQVNLKILKQGKKNVEELFGVVKEEPKPEDNQADKKSDENKNE